MKKTFESAFGKHYFKVQFHNFWVYQKWNQDLALLVSKRKRNSLYFSIVYLPNFCLCFLPLTFMLVTREVLTVLSNIFFTDIWERYKVRLWSRLYLAPRKFTAKSRNLLTEVDWEAQCITIIIKLKLHNSN